MRRRAAASSAGRSSKSHGVAEHISGIQQKTVKQRQDVKLVKTERLPLKTDVQCSKKRSSTDNYGRTRYRHGWSAEEDEILSHMVHKHGMNNWHTIACALPDRHAIQCRIRWKYSLNPAINKEAWLQQEELKLIRAHQVYGNKWADMVKHFPGRTNHSLREHWRRNLKGKLDSYLASELLEQVPDLHEDLSVTQRSKSDIPKDKNVPSDKNGFSPFFQPSPKSKRGITSLGENADTTEENSSNFVPPESLDVRPVKFSEKIISQSQQRARARRKLDFQSTQVKAFAAASTPATSQMSQSRRGQLCSSVCSVPSPNALSKSVATVPSTAAGDGDHPSDVHSSGTLDAFSLEAQKDSPSDRLDMSYCDSLMIDPPSLPHDDGFI